MCNKILAVIILGAYPILSKAQSSQKPTDVDWTKVTVAKQGENIVYLGMASDESSEANAILAAEQDAITQIIKHYFGVKLTYSLKSMESTKSVNLSIDRSESSETLKLQGLFRAKVKVIESAKQKYSAWVQMAIPEEVLRSEKRRIDELRWLENQKQQEQMAQQLKENQSQLVPKLFLGMKRELFMMHYPAPTKLMGARDFEIYYYSARWSICESRRSGCYLTFRFGKLAEWDSVSSKYIDFKRREN